MIGESQRITIPRYYRPWPHQVAAWHRRDSGKYTYYFKLWARQAGKDTDDIQYILKRSWDNPGTQSAYIGLNNVWITNQIFKKYIDGRKHWMDYPEEYIDVHETQKEVTFSNNPEGVAEARIKFIGFLNDEQLVGSSYDNFLISEASLYKQNAFQFIRPIWDRKIAMGLPLFVGFNGTPRGMRNVMYDLMRVYSGVDDPADFPGEHLNRNGAHCYIDKVTIRDLMVPDGHGGFKKLYSDEDVEVLQSQYLREFGNLNFYKQENECDFTVVNAGLVYQGIEQLQKDGRFCKMNLDTSRPVYFAWDISAKDKVSDATACVVFQWYNGRMVIYDIFEARGHSFVECVAEMAKRDYFHLIRWGVLPWDSERSASSETPIEEARRMWPNIQWHALEKERIDRGIKLVRQLLPNMVINSGRCEWLMECFENYEYKRLEKEDDWAAKPNHNRYSHLMDALRYAAMGVNEMQYLQLNDEGRQNLVAGYYDSMDVYAPKEQSIFDRYPTLRKKDKRAGKGLSY